MVLYSSDFITIRSVIESELTGISSSDRWSNRLRDIQSAGRLAGSVINSEDEGEARTPSLRNRHVPDQRPETLPLLSTKRDAHRE